MKPKLPILISILTINLGIIYAQGSDIYGSGIKIKIDEKGEKYLRVITWHQMWIRYNNHNSGSIRNNQSIDHTLDVTLRRSRMLFLTQISPRFLILSHFGINNQSAISGGYFGNDGKRPQLYIHDAWTEYKVWDNYLSIGTGLHYWNGVSRMSSASTLNFLAIDAPIFNWSTIEETDQFARMLGIYAKGRIGILDYRIAVNDPFLTNTGRNLQTNTTTYNPDNNKKVFQGYFSFNLWDKESNFLPYYVGSYLGTKKVLNIGMGSLYHSEAMWMINEDQDTVKKDMLLAGLDVFMDLPLNKNKKTAFTLYSVWYNYNYGNNYVRNTGILNPANGGGSLRGNAFPMMGTGNIFYTQAGFLLPQGICNKARIQPYGAVSSARFEGLRNDAGKIIPVNVIDLGVNFLLEGHHSKITLNGRARPDFTNKSNIKYRPEITLQTMIYL